MTFPTPWQRIVWASELATSIKLTREETAAVAFWQQREGTPSPAGPLNRAINRLLAAAILARGVYFDAAETRLLALDPNFRHRAYQDAEDEARANAAYPEIALGATPIERILPVTRSRQSPPPPPPVADGTTAALDRWLLHPARYVLISRDRGGWRADTAVEDDGRYATVHFSGGDDCVELPSLGAALASLDLEIRREALALLRGAGADLDALDADLAKRPWPPGSDAKEPPT